ncbi:uncharacterized protein LOC126845220 [Adelges cooleyi]|uniref:uncharacterized protein LOC126845220 n=1 Tax=Adelges cooleyi TaxID=133065 RepID=UPI00217FABB7|nr:uncharacterized protein LOC126845220 [Adelges cooleyi]
MIKMKFFCISISLALVNNLVAVLDRDYRMDVEKANAEIEIARNQGVLPDLIQTIVRGNYTMKQIMLMLAKPERDINSDGITLYDDAIANIQTQRDLRTEILRKLPFYRFPVTPRKYDTMSMTDMGNERRKYCSEAVKELMGFVISGSSPPGFRVDITVFIHLCRLIAVHRAIRNPDLFREMVDAKIEDENCVITYANTRDIKYRYFGNRLYEIYGSGNPKQTLSFQVTQWDQ